MAKIRLQNHPETAEAEVAVESKEVATAAVNAQAPISEEDAGVLGSMSDKIAFIACLGDPSKPDVTPGNPEKGIAQRTDPTIVGYAFKALADMDVPECGAGDDFKDNPMSYVNKDGVKHVAAGETFYLTRFETGMLLARPEFNARVTGGEMPVVVSFTFHGKPGTNGQPTVSAATRIPTVTLRPAQTGQSIKDIQMLEVLSFTSEKDDKGRVRKSRKINAGFEKWAPLCKERTVVARAKAPTATNTRNKKADIFLQIVASKKA